MVGVLQPTSFTEKEYLALEAVAEVKHEFTGGRILAMAGAELDIARFYRLVPNLE